MIRKTSPLITLSLLAFFYANIAASEVSTINVNVPKAPKVNATVPAVELIVDGQTVSRTSTKLTSSDDDEPAIEKAAKVEENTSSYGIVDSKRYPPEYFTKKVEKSEPTKAEVGEVTNDRIAAYLQAPLLTQDEVLTKLKAAGFTPISSYKVDKKGKVTSIIFSDDELIKKASKKGRGFAASLRLLIDEENKQISIVNPIYVQKAFLQDDYDDAFAKATLKRLRDNFEGVQNSKDMVKFIRLPRYKFMNGMPVYEDMIVVKEGSNADLLAKAHKSKKVVFEQKLENGATLIGVKLSKRTTKFVKKIGYQNAELLPYPVLIEDGKAYTLAPKYYIAVMYPLLSMSEFMTIATVPGAINKDIDKIFR